MRVGAKWAYVTIVLGLLAVACTHNDKITKVTIAKTTTSIPNVTPQVLGADFTITLDKLPRAWTDLGASQFSGNPLGQCIPNAPTALYSGNSDIFEAPGVGGILLEGISIYSNQSDATKVFNVLKSSQYLSCYLNKSIGTNNPVGTILSGQASVNNVNFQVGNANYDYQVTSEEELNSLGANLMHEPLVPGSILTANIVTQNYAVQAGPIIFQLVSIYTTKGDGNPIDFNLLASQLYSSVIK
jgi:hypothetical protein